MQAVKRWIDRLGYKDYKIEVVSADASLRKYFRIFLKNKSYIIMDSSLQVESIAPFIDVSVRLLKADVQIPRVYAQELELGYLLLEDLGDVHLINVLSDMSAKLLYTKAIYEIIKMQKADTRGLPPYDAEFIMLEMKLMQEWYLKRHTGVLLEPSEQKELDGVLELIQAEVMAQPQGFFVHRDFHSRNIMFAGKGKVWVIDYQDALIGSLLYDLVSLLNDVYVKFKRETIVELVLEFKILKGIKNVSDEQFIRWFDFMAMQRHIKILGIFSRLKIRDNKPAYIKDIPMTLKYIEENMARYAEFKPLKKILDKVNEE